jgi:hypothetical protein
MHGCNEPRSVRIRKTLAPAVVLQRDGIQRRQRDRGEDNVLRDYDFGPRWGLGYAVMRMFGAVAKQKLAAERLSTSDIPQINAWIERNPDLGAIESNPVKPMAARGN